ncbi:MAG: DHH family phosphoesterase, partial [Patescibacteria group bacterium]
DGDTIGSTLGMFHVLQEMGKYVEVFSPKEMLSILEFIPGTEVIQRDPSIFDQASIDLVIIFDCSDGEYFKGYLPKLKPSIPIIVFDHHISNPGYGTLNFIEPNAASTADVVWRFIKDLKLPMNKHAAQAILTGITTDTNTFSTSNTTAACLEAAHELARYGAKIQEIVRETMMNKSLSTLKLWGLAFERLHQNERFSAVTTAITENDIADLAVDEMETKALSNFLNAMVEGTDVVLVLRETDDGGVKASFRSQSRDVAAQAEEFGGGGHVRAAGFKITEARLVEKEGIWQIVKKGGEVL